MHIGLHKLTFCWNKFVKLFLNMASPFCPAVNCSCMLSKQTVKILKFWIHENLIHPKSKAPTKSHFDKMPCPHANYNVQLCSKVSEPHHGIHIIKLCSKYCCFISKLCYKSCTRQDTLFLCYDWAPFISFLLQMKWDLHEMGLCRSMWTPIVSI